MFNGVIVVMVLDKFMVEGSLYTNELIKYVIDLHPPVGFVF